ncbi:unnamed protein product [Adineta ricciae]|uniref:Peptidase S1 domain-containing protein n=1 Tax=Adineta ricciae TaxID=249248 RepID=A0A814I441_ADIRI|nr:unnamed protein product [Adineta ricciae]CAF1540783.1 unnamed protein product [Adineta ricciae]
MVLFFSTIFFLFGNFVFVNAIPSVSFFYPKTLTVSSCTNTHSWTKWFNSGKPNTDKDFDQESLSIIQAKYGRDVCAKPQGVQARTVTALQTDVNYSASWQTMTGIISAFVSQTAGVDFQIRFCCPNTGFVTTTVSPPKPIDDKTCGRPKIKPSVGLTRIFGGSYAVPHSWPWQVLYEEIRSCDTNKLCVDTCGGTLIDSHHVLTAAHCVHGKDLSKIFITAGIHNRQKNESDTRQQRQLDAIFRHPDWNNDTLENDLVILRLSAPVQLNDYVRTACLPGPDPRPNANVILIGWGSEHIDGLLSDELKQTQVTVIDDCDKYWDNFDEDNQICVRNMISGDSACDGDSGSPLLQEYNSQWIVQGVASYIDDCKTNGNFLPNVYVKVSAYLAWIHSIIRQKH